MLTLLTDRLVLVVVLAHAQGVAHVHPHGLDAGILLGLGGLLVLLGFGIRMARRQR